MVNKKRSEVKMRSCSPDFPREKGKKTLDYDPVMLMEPIGKTLIRFSV